MSLGEASRFLQRKRISSASRLYSPKICQKWGSWGRNSGLKLRWITRCVLDSVQIHTVVTSLQIWLCNLFGNARTVQQYHCIESNRASCCENDTEMEKTLPLPCKQRMFTAVCVSALTWHFIRDVFITHPTVGCFSTKTDILSICSHSIFPATSFGTFLLIFNPSTIHNRLLKFNNSVSHLMNLWLMRLELGPSLTRLGELSDLSNKLKFFNDLGNSTYTQLHSTCLPYAERCCDYLKG